MYNSLTLNRVFPYLISQQLHWKMFIFILRFHHNLKCPNKELVIYTLRYVSFILEILKFIIRKSNSHVGR